MASAILGALATFAAVLAALSALAALAGLAIAAPQPRLSAAPVAGCAFCGLAWAALALGLSFVSSALAGR